MNVLNDYKVRFYEKKFFNRNFKLISTINDDLTGYIMDYDTMPKVNQLLNDITAVLSNDYSLGGGQTQSMYLARITSIETKIYQDIEVWEQDNNIQADFILPSADLKVIVEAWKDYLQ